MPLQIVATVPSAAITLLLVNSLYAGEPKRNPKCPLLYASNSIVPIFFGIILSIFILWDPSDVAAMFIVIRQKNGQMRSCKSILFGMNGTTFEYRSFISEERRGLTTFWTSTALVVSSDFQANPQYCIQANQVSSHYHKALLPE